MNAIAGVEIFSVGEWNGNEYTLKDLQNIVTAFSETSPGVRPHLKLGHDKEQKLLQNDGLPAAGWVEKVYIRGDKLLADFIDIPKKIYELLIHKAYRKVSVELWVNSKVNEKIYPLALSAIALLGADAPGVENLNDILAMYKKDSNTEAQIQLQFSGIKTIEKGNKKMEKTEKEIKLEMELETQKANFAKKEQEAKEASDKAAAQEKQISDLVQFKKDTEAKEIKLQAEVEAAKLETFIGGLEKEKLITPAMKPLVSELLGPEKREYSAKIKDKEVKLTKGELLKETLKLFKAVSDVNFKENSVDGDKGDKDNKQKELSDLATKRASEKKITFGAALKEIYAERASEQVDDEDTE